MERVHAACTPLLWYFRYQAPCSTLRILLYAMYNNTVLRRDFATLILSPLCCIDCML